MRSPKKILAVLFALVIFVATTSQAWAYIYTGQRWSNPSTLTIYYDSSLYNDTLSNGITYDSVFSDAYLRWMAALNYKIMFVQVGDIADADIVNNVWYYGNIGWDGMATWYHTNNITYYGNITLNTYHNTYLFATSRGVAVHEIGHILGLADLYTNTSAVMYKYTEDRTPTTPAPDDILGIKNLYGI